MASAAKTQPVKNVASGGLATVLTAAPGHTYTILGLIICNTSANDIAADVAILRSAVAYYVARSMPIVVGGSLVIGSSRSRLVLEANDALQLNVSDVNVADAVISYIDES
jgi:hypothetical protein